MFADDCEQKFKVLLNNYRKKNCINLFRLKKIMIYVQNKLKKLFI